MNISWSHMLHENKEFYKLRDGYNEVLLKFKYIYRRKYSYLQYYKVPDYADEEVKITVKVNLQLLRNIPKCLET